MAAVQALFEENLQGLTQHCILRVMKLANFVTKLQDVLRPKREEPEPSSFQTRQGKRIPLPAKEVERIYRHHRKKIVRVTYTGPTKATCLSCGIPFLFLAEGKGRYPQYHSNACKQKAYRQRKQTLR
jgi:hypothetical protein